MWVFVPEQQQSSQHLPSYWWQEKTRCYQWSGSAPAARHTLSAKLRISAAPGPLWSIQANFHQNTNTHRNTSSLSLWVKRQAYLSGSCSWSRPHTCLRRSCTDSADGSPVRPYRRCWWSAGLQSGTEYPLTSGKWSPESKVGESGSFFIWQKQNMSSAQKWPPHMRVPKQIVIHLHAKQKNTVFPHQLFVRQALCCQVFSLCSCWSPC